jgi:hypothetical protein
MVDGGPQDIDQETPVTRIRTLTALGAAIAIAVALIQG